MFQFLIDFIKYPFDSNNKENKFSKFLKTVLKDYPAFLWVKPTWQRVVSAPLLFLAKLFQKKQ
jgi:hypothetical protein